MWDPGDCEDVRCVRTPTSTCALTVLNMATVFYANRTWATWRHRTRGCARPPLSPCDPVRDGSTALLPQGGRGIQHLRRGVGPLHRRSSTYCGSTYCGSTCYGSTY
eukprot:scaffold54882_cov45-Phaeocystis_antarctica.AAC.1